MVASVESSLGRLYTKTYRALCGKHPRRYAWHFQWLGTFYLYGSLQARLPKLRGRILDVGCGGKPYKSMFSSASEYIGIDIVPGGADLVVVPDEPWPLDDEFFDVVFATQVLEHIDNLPVLLGEISRVCKKDGVIILSFPFIYNEHGGPYDFRRFSIHEAGKLLPFKIELIERQGGIGSTITILFLNWIDDMFNTNRMSRVIKSGLLPVWIPFCLVANFLAIILDRIDRTEKYYNNVLVIFRKNADCV